MEADIGQAIPFVVAAAFGDEYDLMNGYANGDALWNKEKAGHY